MEKPERIGAIIESNLKINGSNCPRPQLLRESWISLDGTWKFIYDDEMKYKSPAEIKNWTQNILVPFAPESKKSGIHDTGFHSCLWYQREFEISKNGLTLIHFGAVDYECRVWVNGDLIGSHVGGHSSFSFDITSALSESGKQQITVCAIDDPHDLEKPLQSLQKQT